MVIHAHAQVVRDPLADVFGVVVVDVRRDGAYDCDGDEGYRRDDGHVEACGVICHRADEMFEPGAELVMAHDTVDDDLQRPWRGETHRRLEQHGKKDEQQGATVWPD